MQAVLGVLSLLWKLYIGIVFSITAIFFYPIIVPMLFSENGKRRSFRVFVVWSWVVRILCLYGVKRVTNNKVPNEPHIIIANHSSYLDIFLMYSIMPSQPFLFLGKSEILSYPLLKTYFKRLNIPVDRSSPIKSARSMAIAAKEARKGWSLVIFPEGGIPDKICPKMIEFKDGAFLLAKNLNIPIVPLSFTNNYRLFSDPTDTFGPARPGICRVHIHPTITSEEVQTASKEELKERCFKIINAPLLKENPSIRD